MRLRRQSRYESFSSVSEPRGGGGPDLSSNRKRRLLWLPLDLLDALGLLLLLLEEGSARLLLRVRTTKLENSDLAMANSVSCMTIMDASRMLRSNHETDPGGWRSGIDRLRYLVNGRKDQERGCRW